MATAPSVIGTPVTALDSTSTTTALVFTKDSSTAVGDLLVAQCAARLSSATFTPPIGWTRINDSLASAIGMSTFWRVADGTEGTTITFNCSAVARLAGGLVRVTGADPTNPIDVKSSNTGLAATNLVATGVTPATLDTDSLLLAFYALSTGTGTITAPAGMTQLWSFVALAVTAAPDVAAARLTLASNAATGNKTATASIAGNYGAQLVIIQPPGVVATGETEGWGMVSL